MTDAPQPRPPLTDTQRILNRARAMMINKGLKRGDALAAASETLKKSEQ